MYHVKLHKPKPVKIFAAYVMKRISFFFNCFIEDKQIVEYES